MDGNVIAGSEENGYVYRISPQGEAFVLFDSPIALTLWGLAAASLLAPTLLRRWTHDRTGIELPAEESAG